MKMVANSINQIVQKRKKPYNPASLEEKRAWNTLTLRLLGQVPAQRPCSAASCTRLYCSASSWTFIRKNSVSRAVIEKRFILLAKADEISVSLRYADYPPPYYNHSFTALRARFDRWLAGKAEEAGTVLITSTIMDEVLKKDDQIICMRARRRCGEARLTSSLLPTTPTLFLLSRLACVGNSR